MMNFPVTPKKNQELREKMETLGISESDIVEKFIRSSGPGGQKVNKTSSCVYLCHMPTGVEVKCMKDRSQSINRFLARRELVRKIEMLKQGSQSEEEQKRAHIRKQKLRRKRRYKKKANDEE
jgi:protein subunit release factor B